MRLHGEALRLVAAATSSFFLASLTADMFRWDTLRTGAQIGWGQATVARRQGGLARRQLHQQRSALPLV